MGEPARDVRASEPLRADERRRLRLLARRTWRFFDLFVGPNDQWLPIDNYQEEPREQTAHRTSPTNIGLMLLSTLSAYDFGYLGPSELSLRVRRAFESIKRLAHYQGHLLNWYDTKNLQPLLPRYVSTVDSGNFAGCLVALKQGCREVTSAPVAPRRRVGGARRFARPLGRGREPGARCRRRSALRVGPLRMRRRLEGRLGAPDDAYATFRALCDDVSIALDRELLALLETGALRHDADALRALRTSMDRLHHQLRQMRQRARPSAAVARAERRARSQRAGATGGAPSRSRSRPLAASSAPRSSSGNSISRERGELSADLDASARRLAEALQRSETRAGTLCQRAARTRRPRGRQRCAGWTSGSSTTASASSFTSATTPRTIRLDAHYYDLLASEARLASYLAIVKGDVPESHWYTLGRPMTQRGRRPAAALVGRHDVRVPHALALDAESARAPCSPRPASSWSRRRSTYGKKTRRALGHLGVGLRAASTRIRRTSIARSACPASASSAASRTIAWSRRTRRCSPCPSGRARSLDNLTRLEAMGMLGTYGLFEAVDMRPERACGRAVPSPSCARTWRTTRGCSSSRSATS